MLFFNTLKTYDLFCLSLCCERILDPTRWGSFLVQGLPPRSEYRAQVGELKSASAGAVEDREALIRAVFLNSELYRSTAICLILPGV